MASPRSQAPFDPWERGCDDNCKDSYLVGGRSVIQLDPAELVGPRRQRVDAMAQILGIDDWLLTTSTAVRTVTGAWSDDVDLFGEWSAPIVAVGSAVMSPAVPPSDARLIDDVAD